MDGLAQRAGLLSELAEQGDIAGIHFEGPFISPCRKGAHSEELLRDPDPAEVRKLIDAARGRARMVTLATELPGGLDSVRLLVENGVIAAIGHTDATYEQTVEAIDAGATVATHLFNAMPTLGHRAPGPIAALLEDERITVELINDGVHLHPASLQLAFHHAGGGRVAFITDAMDAAGFGDGRYMLGPLEVEVADGVARLVEGGSIAGSTPGGLAGAGQGRRPGGPGPGLRGQGRDAPGRMAGRAPDQPDRLRPSRGKRPADCIPTGPVRPLVTPRWPTLGLGRAALSLT
jgi:N-acetylglucosamine-6-phosphate deacetylase